MGEHPTTIPVVYVPLIPPAERARRHDHARRMAAAAARLGVDPCIVFGLVDLSFRILGEADDAAACAEYASFMPATFDRSDPVTAASRFLTSLNGVDYDRATALLTGSDGPPAA